ncbi:MAG: TraB/GumN family protein [Methylotenera sp.]|nr:TraB/GumN family protein [Flavobacterium sp.]
MKKLIRTLLPLLVVLCSYNLSIAQDSKKVGISQEPNSLLWEISGNGIEKPSYLYGTIHMICESDFFMKEKVNTAFAKTSKLALEINMADTSEMKYMQKVAMGTMPLSKQLSASQAKKLDQILQKIAGMSLSQVDNYSMVTVMSLIAMKSGGCVNIKSYEMEFLAKAIAAKKLVIGLEKAQEQMDIISKAFTDEEMINMLGEMNQELFKKSVKDYKQENIKNIYTAATDVKMMNEEDKKLILDNRNLNWIAKMSELMKNESVFFAVGAGHLSGEYGVIKLLRNAGYTVKPILN